MDTTVKQEAKAGDRIKGDEWNWPCPLVESDGYSDNSFPGCQFRLQDPEHNLDNYAVNIKVTGKPRWDGWEYKSRCKLEVVGDGEPSIFFGAVLYHKE